MRNETVASDLREGETEITVHVAPSDRIDGGVLVEFRKVTSPNASWSQRMHLSKVEAATLRDELGEILEDP